MTKAYRVVYTNKDGEVYHNIWKNKEGAVSELKLFDRENIPTKWLSFYDELNLAVKKISYITSAEIEEA